jgi:hypothetical protein
MTYSNEVTFKIKPNGEFWEWSILFFIDGCTFHNRGIGITRTHAFEKAKKWMDQTTKEYLEADAQIEAQRQAILANR